MDEATGEPISEDVLRRIQRAYGELEAHPTVVVGDATLTGYYQLSDVNVPVFEHTLDTWRELIAGKLAGTKLALHSARDLFGDLAVPRPTSQDVNAVVEYISSTGLEPAGAAPDRIEVHIVDALGRATSPRRTGEDGAGED